MGIHDSADPPHRFLSGLAPVRTLIQDYRPLDQGLEWELAALHWRRSGVSPFAWGEVPYAVTSDGELAVNAAAIFLANCDETGRQGPLRVLEIGAGTGLFARRFLDVLRDVCRRDGRDEYHRLEYAVTDASPATVEAWKERGVFADHEGRVVAGVLDAAAGVSLPGGASPGPDPAPGAAREVGLSALFANYVLDSLPAAVVRKGPAGVELLCSRTWLPSAQNGTAPEGAGGPPPEEVRGLVESGREEDRVRLLELVSAFEFETAFVRTDTPPPFAEEALEGVEAGHPMVVNHGALRFLREAGGHLAPGGFVLLNDYGFLSPGSGNGGALDRFGPTVAMGLDFPLLDRLLSADGWGTVSPPGDEGLPIHPRLLHREPLPRTADIFRQAFHGQRHQEGETILEEARRHAAEGRVERAAEAYRMAVAAREGDWRLLGEAAEFALFRAGDADAALGLARAALRINPWFDAWLWNVLGDALFQLGRGEEAQEAFLEARRIHPGDPRTAYSLAFMLTERGEEEAALVAVAEALARDGAGVYRDRLLEMQRLLLTRVQSDWQRRQDWTARRAAAWSQARSVSP